VIDREINKGRIVHPHVDYVDTCRGDALNKRVCKGFAVCSHISPDTDGSGIGVATLETVKKRRQKNALRQNQSSSVFLIELLAVNAPDIVCLKIPGSINSSFRNFRVLTAEASKYYTRKARIVSMDYKTHLNRKVKLRTCSVA